MTLGDESLLEPGAQGEFVPVGAEIEIRPRKRSTDTTLEAPDAQDARIDGPQLVLDHVVLVQPLQSTPQSSQNHGHGGDQRETGSLSSRQSQLIACQPQRWQTSIVASDMVKGPWRCVAVVAVPLRRVIAEFAAVADPHPGDPIGEIG